MIQLNHINTVIRVILVRTLLTFEYSCTLSLDENQILFTRLGAVTNEPLKCAMTMSSAHVISEYYVRIHVRM